MEHIETVLDQCGITDYKKDPPQSILAGNLLHRVTHIQFSHHQLQNSTADFLHLLHPTPAVCGIPRDKSLDKIQQLEKHNREYYSGYCGSLNFIGNTDLFVNLRCMKILPDFLALFVGGGLTDKSVPEDEWEETKLKANTLLSVI